MTEKNNESNSIRGKLLSKFHPGMMKNLLAKGFENTILIYLILAQSTKDYVNMIMKLCNLLAVNSKGPPPSISKLRMLLIGHLCAAQLLLKNDIDIMCLKPCIDKIVEYIINGFIKSKDHCDKR